jgi:putative transposase
VRQLDYKTSHRGAMIVKVGRYYPSSQTCSGCGARTKLPLWQRVYDCDHCGLTLDRDVNAARNIRAEAERLRREQHVASIRGETVNGEPRPGETEPAPGAGGHGLFEAATDPARPALAGVA